VVVHPTILSGPQSLTVFPGFPASFSVSASGTPLYFQWQKNGTNLTDGTNIFGSHTATLVVNPTTTNDAGNYSVIITNACGRETSSNAALTVVVYPTILSQPQSLTVCEGSPASFSVSASGTPLYFQWQKNGTNLTDGTNISGSTATNLLLSTTAANDMGKYTVIITNAWGSVTSRVATLSAVVPPTILFQPQSLTVFPGSPAWFGVSVSNTPPLSFQWQKNGTNLTDGTNIFGSTTTNLLLNPTTTNNAGNYTVIITNACGSVVTSSVAPLTFSTNVPPLTNLLGNPGFEYPDVGKYTNFDAGPTPKWNDDGVNYTNTGVEDTGAHRGYYRAFEMAGDDGAYQISTNTVPLHTGDQVVLIWWALGTTSSDAQGTNVTDPMQIVGIITATNSQGTPPYLNDPFIDTTAVLISSNGLPNAWGQYLLVYTVTPADVGKYPGVFFNTGEVGTNTSNCYAAYDDFYLSVLRASPHIKTSPTNQTACTGATVTFSVSAVGATGYQWMAGATGSGVYTNLLNTGQFSGVTTTNLMITNVTPTNNGDYVVVVSNGNGSVTSTPPANLTVFSSPPVIITPPASQTNYSGATVTFSVSAFGATGYQWMAGATGSGVYTNLLNVGQFSGVNTTNLMITDVTPTNNCDYVVVVSNACGSVISSPPATLTVVVILTYKWDGSTLTLSWPQGTLLQATNLLLGHWVTTTGATSPFSVQPRTNGPVMFYRVRVQ